MNFWLAALCVVTLFIAYLFHYLVIKLKLFAKVIVKRFKIPAGKIVFSSYQGRCHQMMPFINKVKADFSAWKDQIRFFGIYYDDPDKLQDLSKFRAIIGAIVSDVDGFDVESFVAKEHASGLKYKMQSFGKQNVFGVISPLLSKLNIFSAVFRSYPALKKYGKTHGLNEKARCSFEIYDYPAKRLTICFPYGEASEDLLFLSDYEQPAYKSMS